MDYKGLYTIGFVVGDLKEGDQVNFVKDGSCPLNPTTLETALRNPCAKPADSIDYTYSRGAFPQVYFFNDGPFAKYFGSTTRSEDIWMCFRPSIGTPINIYDKIKENANYERNVYIFVPVKCCVSLLKPVLPAIMSR